jgi:hypothetical protein
MDIPDIVQLQNEINDGFKNNVVNKKYILILIMGYVLSKIWRKLSG